MARLKTIINENTSVGDWASLIRVSTDEQFQEGESVDTQRKLNNEAAQKHGGSIYKEYLEDGISAYKKRVQQRATIMELLQDILSGKVKHIVAFKRDRICRDPEDYYYLRRMFSKAGVKVFLTCGTEKWGDEDTNSPTDELLDGLMPLLAKFESMTTAQRVRASVQEAVKRGEWRSGRPPYGYKYNSQTKNVEKVPSQVEVCKLIRELYIQGNGSGKIADLLNNKYKIPYESPAANWNKTHTKQKRDYWYEGVVTSVVAKPIYMGIQVWGGEWYECSAIDPIFTREEWDEANLVYQKKLNRSIPHKYYQSLFIFKDILFCAYCNNRLIPTYKTQRYQKEDGTISVYEYYAYKCEGRWEKHNGCKSKKHNRKHLESAIFALISDRIKSFDIDTLYKELLKRNKSRLKEYTVAVDNVKSEIDNLQKTIDHNIEAYLSAPSSSIIRKQLENKAEKLQKTFEEKQLELTNLISNTPIQEIEQNQIASIYESMKKWDGIMDNPDASREVKRKLALEVIKRIYLDNEGNIDIEFKVDSSFPQKIIEPATETQIS